MSGPDVILPRLWKLLLLKSRLTLPGPFVPSPGLLCSPFMPADEQPKFAQTVPCFS